MTGRSTEPSRRTFLRMGALAALAVPLASACSPGFDESPDPLGPLLRAAENDAAGAKALGAEGEAVATARAAHAAALKTEVDRLNRPKPEQPGPGATPPPSSLDGLKERLATARKQAEGLVPSLPRYRAGMVASIAAGCAALQQSSEKLGRGDDAGPVEVPAGVQLAGESAEAVQQALAAEHAAIWVYGLVSAYLPAAFTGAVSRGTAEHVKRRDVCERMLSAAGQTPTGPEAAYVPPRPVTEANSAMELVATAEADATSAWLGVIDRTDDAALRTTALNALIGSARRGTAWRAEFGAKPVAIAMPGQSA
ncbi:ferritin-like domain-containing protein [Amycolatopsis roodepoortensis]|uniref:ferritin-like domain-containing protein n=1 Tax=Amycolatopsis roodepoortensis TaxID=700274 RepID=UPI00214B6F94|nr:ferritin-like domain-containing protein [Amycolatopsis roodepoortensis]UUV34002.1 ferritin-like domain-containing protein [Amycolatopsis roodepoortensis]